MEKLTGHGIPSAHLVGEVGQHYEDLDTGDLYECRIAEQYSPTHGWPVGGYVWEKRATGEDIQELYGSGGGSSGGGVTSWNDLTDKPFGDVTDLYLNASVDLADNRNIDPQPDRDLHNKVYYISDRRLDGADEYAVIYKNKTVSTFSAPFRGYGSRCEFEIDGEVRTCQFYSAYLDYDHYVIFGEGGDYFIDAEAGTYVEFLNGYVPPEDFKFEIHTNVTQCIDEKFIPDTIARSSSIPADKVFIVEYGKTDTWDIEDAYEENKVCIVMHNNRVYNLTSLQSGYKVEFTAHSRYKDYVLTLYDEGSTWDEEEMDILTISKAASVANAAGETVTAAEFNALLTSLRNAGYMN